MVKPQSQELARSRLGSTDQDGVELRVDDTLPEDERGPDPVPEANKPGAKAGHDEDKPDVPPHERH